MNRATAAVSDRLSGSASRTVWLAAAAAFWGWLVLRWITDWVLPAGVGPGRRQPYVSAEPVANAAANLEAAAASLGPLSGVGLWLADLLEATAFAIPTLPALATGVWLTIVLTVLSIVMGFPIAVVVSTARVYGGPATRWLALSFTELIRGTPLLAQLFVLFFGLGLTQYIRAVPGVGQGFIPDQAIWVAVIGFTINSAAYQSEYLRSALQSVDAGQLTAARAIGLSKLEGLRYVVLPQSLRYAIPGWSNELVYLIKYSSLAAFITVPELFFRARAIASETFRFTVMFTVVALFYLAIVLSASAVMEAVERETAIPGLGQVRRRNG
jgi:polar amino acid transport system permease protein